MTSDESMPGSAAWRAELLTEINGSDVRSATGALLALTYDDPDRLWIEDVLLKCLDPEAQDVDEQVRALAVTCVGHVARLHGAVSDRVVVRIRELLLDPVLQGRAEDAVDDMTSFVPGFRGVQE